MALLQRLPKSPIEVTGNTSPTPETSENIFPTSRTRTVLHTRTGATWFGICAAAGTLAVLIIFKLQNTRSVGVGFLWMHGDLPLAFGLLIASVGTAMVVGTAHITQLRRRTADTAERYAWAASRTLAHATRQEN